MSRVLPALQAAEGQRAAYGKAEGVDGTDRVRAKGHDIGVIAHLDPFLLQLVDNAAAVDIAAEEGENVAALQFAYDLDGHGVGLGTAHDGGKARHAAVDQLDAPRAQLDVVDGAVEMAVVAVGAAMSGLVKLVPARLSPAKGCGSWP